MSFNQTLWRLEQVHKCTHVCECNMCVCVCVYVWYACVYVCVCVCVCMIPGSHVTRVNEWRHVMYEWVMSTLFVLTICNSNPTYKWVMSHMRMSHVTHVNESCHVWNVDESCPPHSCWQYSTPTLFMPKYPKP